MKLEGDSLYEMAQVILATHNVVLGFPVCWKTGCTPERNCPLMRVLRRCTVLFFWRKHACHISIDNWAIDLDTLRDHEKCHSQALKMSRFDLRADEDYPVALCPRAH